MPFGGMIVNKVHFEGAAARRRRRPRAGPRGGARRRGPGGARGREPRDFRALAERDRANIERLAAELGGSDVIQVPYLDDDVHDLAGLMEVNRYLFAGGTEERAAAAAERLR